MSVCQIEGDSGVGNIRVTSNISWTHVTTRSRVSLLSCRVVYTSPRDILDLPLINWPTQIHNLGFSSETPQQEHHTGKCNSNNNDFHSSEDRLLVMKQHSKIYQPNLDWGARLLVDFSYMFETNISRHPTPWLCTGPEWGICLPSPPTEPDTHPDQTPIPLWQQTPTLGGVNPWVSGKDHYYCPQIWQNVMFSQVSCTVHTSYAVGNYVQFFDITGGHAWHTVTPEQVPQDTVNAACAIRTLSAVHSIPLLTHQCLQETAWKISIEITPRGEGRIININLILGFANVW